MPNREDEQAACWWAVATAADESGFRTRLDGTVDRTLLPRLHAYRKQILYLAVDRG